MLCELNQFSDKRYTFNFFFKKDNDETFGENVVEITPETKSDLAELVKKTVS